jgi:hypothetical protein
MGRKRSKISKTNGFQKGNKPWNKGKELEFDNNLEIKKCKRLEHNVYNSYVHEHLNGVLSIHNVDGSHVVGKMLRPKSKIPEVVDYYLPSEVENPNHHTNKVYMGAKVESMYVSEIIKT